MKFARAASSRWWRRSQTDKGRDEAVSDDQDECTAPADVEQSLVADISRLKDLRDKVVLSRGLAKWIPRIAPLAGLFGVKLDEVQVALTEIQKLAPSVEEFVTMPDRFNRAFGARGWIAFASLGHPAMKDAVEAAERGNVVRGEEILVEYYTAQQLEFHLTRMSTLEHFHERQRLAQLAKDDYLAGRYHACVPNILMLIDGLASDAANSAWSFFYEKADLSAWDSVEGHPSGLPALQRLMCLGRNTRRTEELSVPYRHGILHGRDLAFDNVLVAAKCWGALFAVGDWARSVQRNEHRPPPPEPRKSLRQSLREMAELSRDIERFKAWKPRSIQVGAEVPARGPADAYASSTPERIVVEFMLFWKRRNYGDMAKLVTMGKAKTSHSARCWQVKRTFQTPLLADFELVSVSDRSPRASEVVVRAETDSVGGQDISFVVVLEGDDGDWMHTALDKGTWRLLRWDLLDPVAPPG